MKALYISAAALLMAGSVYAQPTVKEVKTTKLDRSKRPQAGPAPEVKLGKAEKFVLPNGLTVFVVENHKLPKVSINLNMDLDPDTEGDKVGYVDMAGALLGTATTTMTKDQINEKIDFIGASLNTSAGGASGSCLKKHLDTYMKIYSDVLLRPKFTQEELDKLKNQAKSGLATEKSSPNAMIGNLTKAVMYGKDHPFGEVQTEQNVDNITLADCQGFYDQNFKPNVGYVTLVGDITVEEAKAMMTKYLGEWNKGEVKEREVAMVNPPLATKVSLVDKPGAAQSTIRITYPLDFKPGNPDELKVKVMNEILGGGASARLFRNLRETYNFTYGAYSSFSTNEYIASFTAFADVRTSATDSAVNEFLKEIIRIKSEKVTAEELDAAKRNMAGNFSIGLEHPSTIAQFALTMEKYKLPADYYQTYLTRLAAVTVDDIYAVAQKYVKPENTYILVVGDKEKVAESLKKYAADGKVTFYDYKGDAAVSIKPMPAGVTVDNVIDNYIKAIGGKEAMMAVKDETMVMTGEMMGRQISFNSRKKSPNKVFLEVKMGDMLLSKTVSDGKRIAQSGMGGNKELAGEELKQELAKNDMNLELKYKELGYNLTALGVDNINGADVYKVEVNDPSGKKHFEYYDVKTGLRVRSEVTEESPQGAVTVVTDFGDYKEVGKLKYPHTVTIDQGGMVIKSKVTSLEVNKKLKDGDFEIK